SLFSCSETLLSRFLVALPPVRALLLCAKHLFVAARVSVDGQSSLLVGSRGGAERRGVERDQAQSALGYFVRRRYSACPVDSCGSIYFVGQPTMSPCGASAARGVCCAPLRSRNVSGRSCPWLRRTNIWRRRTSPRTGSERLNDIGLKVMWEKQRTSTLLRPPQSEEAEFDPLCRLRPRPGMPPIPPAGASSSDAVKS